MSCYTKTKIKRRRVKYGNVLMKDFGIEISDAATNVLVICNGGLANGVTLERVCDTFEKFGHIDNVIMVPQKTYCFVKFKDKSSALEACNGEIVWPEVKGPIHLEFVKDLNIPVISGSYNFSHPPGLVLIENFITEKEEEFILGLVGFDSEKENTSELKHRKVKHYGFEFKYSINNVDLNEPIQEIPKELNFLWDRLREHECGINFVPDQLTINCYEPGQGIPPHVDTHSAFEDGILSLSLQSSVVMDFKAENEVRNVVLPRRSLCLMLGESRYNWTHGITPRKSDVVQNSTGLTVQFRKTRTSLTFRKTRKGDCNCDYPRLCDSYLNNFKKENASDMKMTSLTKEVSSELEGNYVHEVRIYKCWGTNDETSFITAEYYSLSVYEKIANHFSETRQKPWPNVMKFVQSFGTGSILVDVGCGNGKYFSKQTERYEIGCDSSNGLLQLCKQQQFECFTCNCLSIPIRDNVADGCICIAVIHHLTTQERRKKAIQEIVRILRSKGRALIYVWAKNQEKESQKSSYLKQCTKKEKKRTEEPSKFEVVSLNSSREQIVLPVHVNRTNFSHNDLLVPWKLKTNNSDANTGPVHLRFYHVFEDNELEMMCRELDVDVLDYYYDQGNWCIILQKR